MAIGAHMSISGGLHKALLRGKQLGCETIQIFTKSNMQWKARDLTQKEIDTFEQAQADTGIKPVVGHDTYLINLASPDKTTHKKSVDSLIMELLRSEAIGLPYLVMHPGAHMDKGERWGLKRIATSLNAVFRATRGANVQVLLETTAGQGSNLGYMFEHLAQIMNMVDEPERLAVCYDTCHAFAAGYDIRTEKAYNATMREFDRIVGLKKIKVFHLNDARNDLGSRVDRHEHIGKGRLGLDAFRFVLSDPRFKDVPKILETPKGETKGRSWDEMNLATLRGLLKKSPDHVPHLTQRRRER
jgi:deoxyribonuclease-4